MLGELSPSPDPRPEAFFINKKEGLPVKKALGSLGARALPARSLSDKKAFFVRKKTIFVRTASQKEALRALQRTRVIKSQRLSHPEVASKSVAPF